MNWLKPLPPSQLREYDVPTLGQNRSLVVGEPPPRNHRSIPLIEIYGRKRDIYVLLTFAEDKFDKF
jgi:hypothetical protein